MRAISILVGLLITIFYIYYNNSLIEEYNKHLERIEPIIDEAINYKYYYINDAKIRDEIRNRIDKEKLDKMHDNIIKNSMSLSVKDKLNLKLNYLDTLEKQIHWNVSVPYVTPDENFVYREYELYQPYRTFNDSIYFKYEIGNNCYQSAKNYEIVGSSPEKESVVGNNNVLFKINLKEHVNDIIINENNKTELLYHYYICVKNTLSGEIDTIYRTNKIQFKRDE